MRYTIIGKKLILLSLLLASCNNNNDTSIYTGDANELREFAKKCRIMGKDSPSLTTSITIKTQRFGWKATCKVKPSQ